MSDRSCAHPGCLAEPTGEVTTFYCIEHHPHLLPARYGQTPCLSEREAEIDRLRAEVERLTRERDARRVERDDARMTAQSRGDALLAAESRLAAVEALAEEWEREYGRWVTHHTQRQRAVGATCRNHARAVRAALRGTPGEP